MTGLARENGWTLDFALRAIDEYKKFMFLVSVTNQPLTPSDEVDQVWHLHLLYTQSYWKEFCAVCWRGKFIMDQHGAELKKVKSFTDWYSKALSYYKEKFKIDPPADIWPSTEVRFQKADFKRINTSRNWIIKKPFT